ncbi:B12-binding domain-containing radical SAM protein [Pseudodesulfovibrio sp.]|nr:B12-binding domain-containing radical SAM protein [Pseudodesulfovibrio sp.]
MNVLMLNPPFKGRFSRSSRSPAVTKGGTLYYPIWLAYAAGVVDAAGHEVLLLDAPAKEVSDEETLRRVTEFKPDLVVVDTSTPSIYSDVDFAGRVKDATGAHVALVGTHPSALPEETLELDGRVDSICLGEFDYTVRDLADALEKGKSPNTVAGLACRVDGVIKRTAQRDKIEDLDEVPFVSSVYERFLDPADYFFAAASYPMMMLMTGRGCPFRCFFCVYPQVFHSRRYRGRSPQNVADEFAYIAREFPQVKEIGIEDDCFTADKKRAAAICELLIEQGNELAWYCNVRGDLDYDLLVLMKKAGCRLVTVGFESGRQDILNAINKGETVTKYKAFAKAARKAGVLVHGCIMTGNPGDTPETLRESYEFACEINCDSMQFYPLYVYPGTEAFTWAEDNGYLKTRDFSKWLTPEGTHDTVIDLPGFSGSEMMRLCDEYLKKYHLRPSYLVMKMAQAVRSPREGYRSIKSAGTLFSKIMQGQMGGARS